MTMPQDMATRPANRLIEATSPYLLQHAHNPVDWYPWGPEALERAKAENKPIFLSIGYSACHWCHVMEREVFENPQIAALMNQHFVNIKVDREERPDLDELYMLATQVATGSGGWPMSVWLTPDLEPFFAGTYFPPTDAHGRPGFPRLCSAIAEKWRTAETELRDQARHVVEAVRIYADEAARSAQGGPVDLGGWLALAVEQEADRFDDEHGGLGSAPKFPPSQALRLWLEILRTEASDNAIRPLPEATLTLVRTMLTATLDHMMRGGIYDQVGGGFARYSTDQYWLVPHFEKMLYDNAQLAPAYALASVLFNRADYARIARQTLDFWLREMTGSRGGCYSALDADSDGVEGKYYVWTLQEIRQALPNADDAELIVQHLGVAPEGNWPEGGPGANVLHVARTVDQLAPRNDTTPEALQKRIDALLKTLREARAKRTPPARDDKVLTGWNGLMISAMAITGRLLHEPKYLEAAHRAMGFILLHHMERGRRLLRVSRAAPDAPRDAITAHIDAFLEDHAYLLNGLMDLIDATTPTSLPGTMARKRALELADTLVRDFRDPDRGGFFFTSRTYHHDKLFARIQNATDGATPSAAGMAIRALLRLAQSSGKIEYRDIALRAVEAFSGTISGQPAMFATVLHGLLEDARWHAKRPTASATPAREDDLDLVLKTAPAPSPPPTTAAAASTLTLTGPASLRAKPGQTFDLALTLRIAPGYHIQLHEPADREAFATVARVRADKLPIAAQRWDYPEPQSVAGPESLQGYAGTVTLTGHLTLDPAAAPGRYSLRASILAQPCTGTSCLAPEKATLEIPLEVE